ncbi:MAG: ompA, partial [Rhodospirillales bacterium]|nr:ompA [Rhodospirillales bacterium]
MRSNLWPYYRFTCKKTNAFTPLDDNMMRMMMNKRLCVLGAVLLCSVSSAAMAQQLTGPYLGGGIGGSFALPAQSTGPSPQNSSSVTYDAGIASYISGGYEFGNGLRAELQIGSSTNNVDHSAHGALAGGGHTTEFNMFGNVLYDFYGLGLPVIPHVGVGVGEMLIRTAGVTTVPTSAAFNGHSAVAAYQAIVGVEYPVAENLKVGLEYRYIGTQDADTTGSLGGSPIVNHYSFNSNNIFLTVRVEFGTLPAAPAPLPAVVTPPPAPPAKAPEVQRAFQVFFDFNKSDITAAAAKVIQQASDSVKAGHMTQINVTGHTDTVGSAKYNQALSERRAAAVKQQLITDG